MMRNLLLFMVLLAGLFAGDFWVAAISLADEQNRPDIDIHEAAPPVRSKNPPDQSLHPINEISPRGISATRNDYSPNLRSALGTDEWLCVLVALNLATLLAGIYYLQSKVMAEGERVVERNREIVVSLQDKILTYVATLPDSYQIRAMLDELKQSLVDDRELLLQVFNQILARTAPERSDSTTAPQTLRITEALRSQKLDLDSHQNELKKWESELQQREGELKDHASELRSEEKRIVERDIQLTARQRELESQKQKFELIAQDVQKAQDHVTELQMQVERERAAAATDRQGAIESESQAQVARLVAQRTLELSEELKRAADHEHTLARQAAAEAAILREGLWPAIFCEGGSLENWRSQIESATTNPRSIAPMLLNVLHRYRVTCEAGLADTLPKVLGDVGKFAYRFWLESGLGHSQTQNAAREWQSAFEADVKGTSAGENAEKIEILLVTVGETINSMWMNTAPKDGPVQQVLGWGVRRNRSVVVKADVE